MNLTDHDRLIARNVRALLHEAHWIESDLADRTGLCERTITRVLSGQHARRDTLNKIALAFGLGTSEPYYPSRVLRTHATDQVVLLYQTLHAPPDKPRLWKSIYKRICAFAPLREK